MVFLAKIPRPAEAVFASIAELNASQLNFRSVKEAIATPPITGIKDAYTTGAKNCLRNKAENKEVNAGSAALMMWVKETAPAPREMTALMWAMACMKATGKRFFTFCTVSLGALRMPSAHKGKTYSRPRESWMRPTVQGRGSTFRAFLL
eukprot:evm.model.NODE_17363_length_20350_cov_19.236412.3